MSKEHHGKQHSKTDERTLEVAREEFKKDPGNQTADTPGQRDDPKSAERRTMDAARSDFKKMPGNQTPNTPGKKESAPQHDKERESA